MLLCLKRQILTSLGLIWLLVLKPVDLGLCMGKPLDEKEVHVDPILIVKAFESEPCFKKIVSMARKLAQQQVIKDKEALKKVALTKKVPDYSLEMKKPLTSLISKDESDNGMSYLEMINKYPSMLVPESDISTKGSESLVLSMKDFFENGKSRSIKSLRGAKWKKHLEALTLHIILTAELKLQSPKEMDITLYVDGGTGRESILLDDLTRKYPKQAWLDGKLDRGTVSQD